MGTSLNWTHIQASVVGTSHLESQKGCQDSCFAQVFGVEDNSKFLCIFVADGAGSASHGGEGAEKAIQTAASFISEEVSKNNFQLSEELAIYLVENIQKNIKELSLATKLTMRDFACTFIGVVSSTSKTIVMQIGDGGVSLDTGDGLFLPIIPMIGEYANMTNFVTDENALDVLQVKILNNLAYKVAVFSDGIQRLALDMTNNKPHIPFFTPLFDAIAKTSLDEVEGLNLALVNFLNSPRVNQRTDDDKTLVLATFIG